MIYLDNAATTLHKPKEVQEAVIAAFGADGKFRKRGIGAGT